MKSRNDESGIIVVALLLLATVMVFGYVIINSISKSREAEQIKDSASDVIDAAKDSVEAVNEAREKAERLIVN